LFTPNELKHRAIEFSHEHANDSSENSEKQIFWNDFFAIFGLSSKRIGAFEARAKTLRDTVGFIDYFWPGTLLVEHKSRGENLDKALTQALDYCVSGSLKEDELPRFIIVSDFARFRIMDLVAYRAAGAQLDFVEMRIDQARETPLYTEFPLEALYENLHRFNFILGYEQKLYKTEDPVNIEAAELMGALHDELKDAGYIGHELELFLVRIMFCFFADDTGIFPRDQFSWLLEAHTHEDGRDLGPLLAQVFQILNTPYERRMKTLDTEISLLPYVNGGLFAEILPLPAFNKEMAAIFMKCCHFDWSRVSPAIFGSLFQSVMDAEARRNLGAHYTSEKNIMKTIHGLFLDEYIEILKKARGNVGKLNSFLELIRTTRILDPACGCGNFLILAYRELRILEIEAHKEIQRLEKQKYLDLDRYRGIDVENMYGIEIEEFPAQIARTALWIMDHLMNVRLSEEFVEYFVHLPLTSTPHIICGNALRLDWKEIISPEKLNYIIGNPPFVGSKMLTLDQRSDVEYAMGHVQNYALLDLVSAWYVKAIDYIQGTTIECAFVSTNSITQGEQVGILWSYLLVKGSRINFAHRTFKWMNEARGVAAVYCVIIGFAIYDRQSKVIYDYPDIKGEAIARSAKNINPYLVDSRNLIIRNANSPICKVPQIKFGNQPIDGGGLILSEEECEKVLQDEPSISKYIRPYIGADEFINNKTRYCLWLLDADPEKILKSSFIRKRLEEVRQFRLSSKREVTRQLAQIPYLFAFISHEETEYLLIPSVSSERRDYIPIGFMKPDVIASNLNLIIPGATYYHFGILQSHMHMAWMRQVCGRLKSDYRYSNGLVYNNYPWPAELTKAHQEAVEVAAQSVLNIRAQFSGSSLATLYDPLTMPAILRKAHKVLDAAVDKCYRKEPFTNELDRVQYLFDLYEKMTIGLVADALKPMRKKRKS